MNVHDQAQRLLDEVPSLARLADFVSGKLPA